MITANQKSQIAISLKDYVDTFSSQSKAAASLHNVSEATVIQVLKSNWQEISETMWTNIGKQLGYFTNKVGLVETQDVRTMVDFFTVAREEGAHFSIIGKPGSSKTYTSEYFETNHRKSGVYHIPCSEYWNKKQFLAKILSKMGVVNTGYNVGEMMNAIVTNLRKQYQPLLIIDEIDKLDDRVFLFYITLYNELHGVCGICLMGTDYLKKRILRGVERNTRGYKEIYSRIGSKFIELDGTDKKEVAEICKAHGITNALDITEIYNSYNGDLRAVDRQVLKQKLIARATKN
jgi:Cdc6-like AAA superfamily ATPase